MMGEPILKVQLDASYRGKQVLCGVAFVLMQGEVLGLVGTSGAGKSTLVLSLLGLLPWRGGRASGSVIFAGKNLLQLSETELRKLRGKEIALVPQSPLSALNPAVSLDTHFREAWLAHEKPSAAALKARVEDLMNEVNLPYTAEFMRRRPGQISVGQAQRVLIALALLHRPVLLIADEPTSALDPVTQAQIVALLCRVTKTQGATLLYISHDLVSVLQLSSRIAVLDRGRIAEILPANLLSAAKQDETKSLLAALPVPLEVMMRFNRRNDGDAM
jgi:peptide/nickel transport system ATP-binding protein